MGEALPSGLLCWTVLDVLTLPGLGLLFPFLNFECLNNRHWPHFWFPLLRGKKGPVDLVIHFLKMKV